MLAARREAAAAEPPTPPERPAEPRTPRPGSRRPRGSDSERRRAAHAAQRSIGEAGHPAARGLGFTARAVMMLAPDLDISSTDMVYVATWAPEIAARAAYTDSATAFLSREELTRYTGLDGGNVMSRGGAAERTERTVGLIRIVARGVPGAVPRGGGRGWRGNATEWTLTADLATWVHTPASTGEARKAVPDELRAPDLDPDALDLWLDPRFPWWGHDAAGYTGLRLVAVLLGRYGAHDVTLGAADAGRLLGISRRVAWYVLQSLEETGLAVRADRGRWTVQIASRLALYTADDLKHIPARRTPPPTVERAEMHDWSWFDPEGRTVRAAAREAAAHIDADVIDVADSQFEEYLHTRRGIIIALVEFLYRALETGRKAARALLAPAAALAAGSASGVLIGSPAAPQAPPAAVAAPSPPPDLQPSPEVRSLARRIAELAAQDDARAARAAQMARRNYDYLE